MTHFISRLSARIAVAMLLVAAFDAAALSNAWTLTSSLGTARTLHTATVVSSGKVLMVGGNNGVALASAELFDPAFETWFPTGSLAVARSSHTATLLQSGMVLVAGGLNGASLNSAELYNPATNAWSATGPLTTARRLHTATLLPSGKVLVAGGLGAASLASAELYDPATNTWSATGPLISARRSHTATLLPSGKVLVAGGFGTVALATAELYDPATGTWSAAGSLAGARQLHTATLLTSGKVLAAAGQGTGGDLANAEQYDPALNIWSAAGLLATARSHHTATLMSSGHVLVVAGSATIALANSEMYDPATNTWSAAAALAPLNTARTDHTATLLSSGKVLGAGGFNGASLASAELYLPGTQSLTFAAQTPATHVFAAGGTFAINPLATNPLPNSGNAIVYSSLTTAICTVSGTTVTIVSVGTCTLAANQAGDAVYAAAAQVTQDVAITMAAQTLTFPTQAPATRTFAPGGTFAIGPAATSAVPNSGNAIAYSSLTTSVCTVSGTNVTMVAAGTCTLAGDQAGDANYAAAAQVTQDVAITMAAQTLTFPAQTPAIRVFAPGGAFAILPAATSAAPNSGNAIVYSSLTVGVCTVSGTTVTIVSVGTCTIAANQAGDGNYTAATQVTQDVAIAMAAQALVFPAQTPATHAFAPGGAFAINPLATSAVPNSGNAIAYSSLTASVCTVSGSTVTIVSVGTCTIAANQAGDANYTAAAQVTRDVAISVVAQTLTFPAQALPSVAYKPAGTRPIFPVATSAAPNSGNAIVYSSLTASVCTVSGTLFTILSVGTCTIAVNQAGDANFTAAPQVTQDVTITVAPQALSFPAQFFPSRAFTPSGAFAILPLAGDTAVSTSNPIVYSSLTPGVCTVSGTTVTMVSVGTCTIAANQAGDANIAAAVQVTQDVAISVGAQTLTFPAQTPPTRAFVPSSSFAINPLATSAAPNSGNAIGYSSLTAAVCTVSLTTVNIVSVGTCTIAANQPGDANYAAAAQVTQDVAIGLSAQTLTFPAQTPASRTFSASGTFAINPVATSAFPNSTNAIVYSSLTASVCTVSGTTVTIVSAGTCTIAANQAGDANYAAAAQLTQGIAIATAPQTLSFPAQTTASRVFAASGTFAINPLASNSAQNSGNAVVYSSLTTSVCTVAGTTVTMVAAGTCTIAANQAGDANYATAAQVTQSVTITPANLPRLINISTRMQVLTGNDVMIGGFVIGGSANKTVAIVATGPSLTQYGITNALTHPTLTLVRSSDQSVIATNDGWQNAGNAAQLTAAGFAPSNPIESAILANLAPGAYTAIVQGAGGGTGVAVVGVYEVDGGTVPLVNISTRGRVLTGNDVMIGGFVIDSAQPKTLAIVATGPSLAAYGIAQPLANPTITLVRSSDQTVVASNDDWQQDANAAQLLAAGFAPTNPLESALLVTLPAGAYTVIVSGVGGTTGVAVIGVYAVD